MVNMHERAVLIDNMYPKQLLIVIAFTHPLSPASCCSITAILASASACFLRSLSTTAMDN